MAWRRQWLSQLPSLATLTRGLDAVLRDNSGRPVTVVDREVNMSWSRSASEIVTCNVPSRGEFRVLCKYELGGDQGPDEHRGGLWYEAEVYRSVLSAVPLSVPAFYGAYADPRTGLRWIMMEFLEDAVRLHKVADDGALGSAARWAGHFHAAHEAQSPVLRFLRVYDEQYYRRWALRTSLFAKDMDNRYSWLTELCNRSDEWIAPLIAAPLTVVHGEYYPDNILVGPDGACPLDWESAAVAPGEVDLACLTGGAWLPHVVSDCEATYCSTRWPSGTPAHFATTLSAARVYLHLRWLGDRHDQITSPRLSWRFEQLRDEAQRLGVM